MLITSSPISPSSREVQCYFQVPQSTLEMMLSQVSPSDVAAKGLWGGAIHCHIKWVTGEGHHILTVDSTLWTKPLFLGLTVKKKKGREEPDLLSCDVVSPN